MNITRQSIWSGKITTQDLPVTQDQVNMWRRGIVIQIAMPGLTIAQREFIITGITEDEWRELAELAKEDYSL